MVNGSWQLMVHDLWFMIHGSWLRVQGSWMIVTIIGCSISISIEVMQFVYRLGFAEVDDVMHNIIGCVLGYMLVKGS